MRVLLWIIQAGLALLYLSGGAYKIFGAAELASQFTALPRGLWGALGGFEMVGAILLVVPAAVRWRPYLTSFAAAALALETLALAALYAGYSLELAITNPMIWAVPMGVVAAFVAYRWYLLTSPVSTT